MGTNAACLPEADRGVGPGPWHPVFIQYLTFCKVLLCI